MTSPETNIVARRCCPDHCVDDLCVHSDIGLCGHERCSLFDDDEDYDAPCEWDEEP